MHSNQVKLYHITPVDSLQSIFRYEALFAESSLQKLNLESGSVIGMQKLKIRRSNKPVRCHVNLNIGDCVPFYYCPRSIMLYMIAKANHPELHNAVRQQQIVHLEFELDVVAKWALTNNKRWAITRTNATAAYTIFYKNMEALELINWSAVNANLWTDPTIKEGKMAEFLLEGHAPSGIVSRIGVMNSETQTTVRKILVNHNVQIPVEVLPEWYY